MSDNSWKKKEKAKIYERLIPIRFNEKYIKPENKFQDLIVEKINLGYFMVIW